MSREAQDRPSAAVDARSAERLSYLTLKLRQESQEVELAIQEWGNKVGKEVIALLEKNGPDLPPAEAARFLRLWALRSLLLGRGEVNSIARHLDSLRDALLTTQPKEPGTPRDEPVEVTL